MSVEIKINTHHFLPLRQGEYHEVGRGWIR